MLVPPLIATSSPFASCSSCIAKHVNRSLSLPQFHLSFHSNPTSLHLRFRHLPWRGRKRIRRPRSGCRRIFVFQSHATQEGRPHIYRSAKHATTGSSKLISFFARPIPILSLMAIHVHAAGKGKYHATIALTTPFCGALTGPSPFLLPSPPTSFPLAGFNG